MTVTAVDPAASLPAAGRVRPGDVERGELIRLLYGEADTVEDRKVVADLAVTGGVTGRVLVTATGEPRAAPDLDNHRPHSPQGRRRFRGPAQADVESLLWRWCRHGGTAGDVADDYIAGGGDEWFETDPTDDLPRP